MLHRSFKPAKCKTSLKLAVARLKLLKNKREVQVRQMKKDLAHLLETGQEKTAMIRVEHVVREEKTMAAYDFIDIYCELIATRLPIIESQKICPVDLKEAISSLIFAAPRCADIPELVDVRKHFTAKYGKDFITAALELRPNCGVNRTVVENLSARAPDGQTKLKILTEVAKEHNVKWDAETFGEKELKPPEDLLKPMEPPVSHVPSYGQGPDRANFEASTIHTPANDTSGGLAEGSKYTRPSSQNSNEFAPNRQNWTMDFKDATSAAQAAAESAEKASLAARAAAEFANLGMGTGQYSMGSQEPMMRDQQRYRNERQSMQGVSDSMLESQNVQRRYSNSASSVSGVSNIEGDSNRTHKYQQKSPFDVDIDNNGRQTKKPEKTNSQSTQIGSVDHLQHVVGSGHTDSVGEGVRRQLSGSYSSSSDDNGDVRSVSDLPKYGSDSGDNLFNSNTDRGNMQSGSKQPSFDRYSSVIFDEPVSEDETTEHEFGNPSQDANSTSQVLENRNNLSPNRKSGGSPSYDDYSSVVFDEPVFDDTTVHKYGYSDASPGKNSISQFSEYRSTSSPGGDRVEVSEGTPRTQSHLFTESRSPAEFTESIAKTSSSQSADLLPATFDDSDGIESESEEETSKPDFSGRTESVDQLPRTNSFNRSPESQEKVMPNIPERMVKVVNRKPWLDSSSDDSDFDSEETKRHNTGTVSRIKNHELGDSFNVKSSYRHTETANRLAGNKATSYSPVFEEKQQSKQSSRYSLDQDVKSGGDSLALGSSDEVQDGGELDLGRLRGGFRNKGYIRPPYRKQQQTDDSNDEQVKSSGVRTKTNRDTLNQDDSSHNQQLRAPRELGSNNSRATFESENDETEGSPPQISGSRYKLGSRLSRRTRDSAAASDVSSPSASTSRSRMEKIPDRDDLHPKSSLSEVNHAKNSDMPAKSSGSWRPSRTNISKQNPDPQPQSRQTNLPVEHQPSKPGRPIRDDNLKLSQSSVVEDSSSRPDGSGKADILKQSSLGKESVSRENSLKKASHVHPKLPDYDSFAAHFQNMRSSR